MTHLAECVLVRLEVGRRGHLVVPGARGVRRPRQPRHHPRVGVAVGVGGAGHVAGVRPACEVIGSGRSAGATAAHTDLLTSCKYLMILDPLG